MRGFLVAAALLLAAGAATASCGGNGSPPLSLEAYLTKVADSNRDSTAEAALIQERLTSQAADITSVDEAVDVLSDAIDDFLAVATGVRDDLDAMEPPQEVADLHGELTDIFDEAVQSLLQVQTDLRAIDTSGNLEDVTAEFEDFATEVGREFTDLGSQSNAVCRRLQAIGDDQGLSVDLDCDPEG